MVGSSRRLGVRTGQFFAPCSSFSADGIMSQRRHDLHELQRSLLAEDLREDVSLLHAGSARSRGSSRPESSRRNLDIHELLKREAFDDSPLVRTSVAQKKHPSQRDVIYGVSDQYIILDTAVKMRDSAVDRGEFRWNIMVQGVTGDEVLGVKDKIDNVIEIQIGSFNIPHLPEVPYILAPPPLSSTGTDQLILISNNNNTVAPYSPTLVPNLGGPTQPGQYPTPQLVPTTAIPAPSVVIPWIHNPYTQVPFFDRFTVQIREAGLQSYSDRNGARHHYEFSISSPPTYLGMNPNMLLARPQSGNQWDTFIFTDPLNDIHGITLVFRNPDIPIRFLPDCLYDVSIEVDSALAPGPFICIHAPNHNLNMGDRIFITGFKSGNTKLDAFVNRLEGLVAAGSPSAVVLPPGAPIAGTYFWTDPAISIMDLTIQVPVLPQSATVCIAKRRMRIPMRLRRVIDRHTNYIAP